MSVKDLLLGVEALQKVDLRIAALRKEGAAHPKRLAEIEADLATARVAADAERARQADNERMRREKDNEIQAEKEKVKKWESRLSEQRTTREYAALAREIDIAKKANENLEEEKKLLAETAEEIKKSQAEKEAELRRREEACAAERKELTSKTAAFNTDLKNLEEKRREAAKAADPALLARYETIARKRGTGLAPVVNGICKGCNMRVMPHLHNILRAGAIENCPSCQRLIYASETLSG